MVTFSECAWQRLSVRRGYAGAMRVVVSVGGSVLVPTLESGRIREYARMLSEVAGAGHEVGVVVGGGPVAREYIEAGRELGADEISLDQLGIAATRLNARLLIAALGEEAVTEPLRTFERADEAFRRGEIPVMGGTVPGHTTDTVATALAERVGADRVIYATSVSGVFDADPKTAAESTKFTQLSPAELVEVIVQVNSAAGSNAPVDLLAAKLLERSGMHAVVLDGTEPERVGEAITGDHTGTAIRPEQ